MNCKRWPALLAAAVLLSAGFSSAADQYNKNPVAFKEASLPTPDQIKDLSIYPAKVTLKQDRLEHWLKQGAKPSATVAQLIKLAKKTAAQAAK